MRLRRATAAERRHLERAVAVWRREERTKRNPARFNQDQLAIGTMIEREHTRYPEVALRIAMDHLAEREDYYALLERMERTPRLRRRA